MHLSEFFNHLSESYQAELDDLRTDSEGKDVLRKRLQEKRRELGFLSQMLETCPEMVAVVLHGAFAFTQPTGMAQLASLEADDLPDWEALQSFVKILPWASPIVRELLLKEKGSWFLTVAAVLEYVQQHPAGHTQAGGERSSLAASEDADTADAALAPAHGRAARNLDDGGDFDSDDAADLDPDHDVDEASDNWLEGQGFDRKG
jgi:hypothetical protein